MRMWCVVQTVTGKEDQLIQMIQKKVPHKLYEDCFIAYYERIWRKQGKSIVHVERMFPGYVLILTEEPENLFLYLRQVPMMSNMLADGEYTFLSLEDEEASFLEHILGEDHIARLSYIETGKGGSIRYVSGPLKQYLDRVTRFQFKKRYAVVSLKWKETEKTVLMGIILKEDVRQEAASGNVRLPKIKPETERTSATYEIGDQVRVISEGFEDVSGVVWKVTAKTIEVGIRMFDQDIALQVPIEGVCPMDF